MNSEHLIVGGVCTLLGLGALMLRAKIARAATAVAKPKMPLDLDAIPFVPTKSFRATPPGVTRKIDVLVIHDAEYPERPTGAEDIAAYFKNPTVPSSAHYSVDNDSIAQSVKDNDVAWAAPPMNDNGIHVEFIGYAKQTGAEWRDAYSEAELQLAAKLFKALALKHNVPIEFVDAEGLKAGKRGITTHEQISKAFHKSDHGDPGPNFPLDYFMGLVRAA